LNTLPVRTAREKLIFHRSKIRPAPLNLDSAMETADGADGADILKVTPARGFTRWASFAPGAPESSGEMSPPSSLRSAGSLPPE